MKALQPRLSLTTLLLCGCAALSSLPATAKTTTSGNPSVTVKLTAAGAALMPIVISDKASPAIKTTAESLKTYLGRISGATFTIQTAKPPFAPTAPGLVLGVATDFVGRKEQLKVGDPSSTEDYTLRTFPKGFHIVGGTDLAVDHGIWDFLYRLGYRQFFPGQKWEYVPKSPDISIAADLMEHPDYLQRRIWFGWGSMPENLDAYNTWMARNRVAMGVNVNNNHSYGLIILRNKAEFNMHPEYYAQIDGKRAAWDGAQFCISNPDLRKLVVADAMKQLEADPTLQSISVEPNDGGGWCTCEKCLAMGSVSNRVVTLANEVAEAVTAKYPGKFIGMLAYNEHSAPPTIKVHPRVVVNIATAFLKTSLSVDQLVEAWGKQASIIGIYDYYSFVTWDWNMPGLAKAGNLDYLKDTTPRFYNNGARFMVAESSDNWGPNGLGYYVASRLLWDVTEAKKVEALKQDFLDKMFGPAKEPMAEWYRLVGGASKTLLTEDLVGRMYRQLDKSLKLTDDPAIRARLYDLALYTRFVELGVSSKRFPDAAEQILRLSWRIRTTQMVHTRGEWVVMEKSLPPEAANNIPEGKNPWKSSEPYPTAEIEKFISDGIANNKVEDFQEVSFSRNLVPATPLNLESGAPGNFGFFRDIGRFYTWVAKSPATIPLEAWSGVSSGPVAGEATISLSTSTDPTKPFPPASIISEQKVARDNKQYYPLKLKSNFPGLFGGSLNDGTAGTRVNWPEGTPLTFESGTKWQHSFQGFWTMYFYVPKGTTVVGGYKSQGAGQVVGPDGKVKVTFDKDQTRAYWSAPVAPGEDGKLWLLKDIAGGEVRLMTVPPYLARSAQELLLPKEIVEADQPKSERTPKPNTKPGKP